MLETIIGAAGGGAGLMYIMRRGPRFLMELAVMVTAFQRDPTVHNRLRKSLKDLPAGTWLTVKRLKK